ACSRWVAKPPQNRLTHSPDKPHQPVYSHEATFPHGGSVAQYEKHFKVKYESTESVLAASKKGWLANKIPKAKPGRCS
ncbi:hypothetical protein OC610_24435, partial [Pseudomonas sp. SAICEU22]|nr:hypothetical protein [Pseudomonas agronomica]